MQKPKKRTELTPIHDLPKKIDGDGWVLLYMLGSFAPAQVQHMELLFLARQECERRGKKVLGVMAAPSADESLIAKLGYLPLPFEARVRCLELLLKSSPCLAGYPALVDLYLGKGTTKGAKASGEHLRELLEKRYKGRVELINVFGLDALTRIRSRKTIENSIMVLNRRSSEVGDDPDAFVSRHPYAPVIRYVASPNWREATLSSTLLRAKWAAGEDISKETHPEFVAYLRKHGITLAPPLPSAAGTMDLDLMMQHVSFYYKPKDDKGDELPLAENWAEGLMPASWAEFELGTQLGHGRQAVVCVARYKGQSFAVKRSVTSGSKTNRNIARELYLLSRLRPHPNVIAIHGGGVTPEGHLFMMLQLGFLSVTAQLQKQQPPLANDICSPLSIAWLRVLRDSARGMAHVHGCGIVHRDLSCDNVILLAPLEDPGCRAVISDFGVAQELRDSSRLVRGACRKYPPEAMGATQDYLPASDVFMFACLVYEVLCGRVYFAELSTADACSATLRGSRPKLPDTPALARLVRLVTHCWAQDHRRRPTFLQIAEELDGLCSAA